MNLFQPTGARPKRFWGAKREEDAPAPDVLNKIVLLPVDSIVPNSGQPRRTFSDESLRELAQSIEENGLLQPVTVRLLSPGPPPRYELVAGERRLRAFRLLGRAEIPGIVEEFDDVRSHTLALIENVQRDDLSYFDQALAIRSLMEESGYTQADVARRLGMAQSTVANKLRLLKLDEPLRDAVTAAGFTERHARCLLLLSDPAQQREAVEEIARRGMNVAQTEQYIQQLLHAPPAPPDRQSRRFIPKDVRIFVNTIHHAVETMRSAGIEASAEQDEDEKCIRYIVRISKQPRRIVRRVTSGPTGPPQPPAGGAPSEDVPADPLGTPESAGIS